MTFITSKTFKSIAASLVVVTMASVSFVAPAAAGGQISFNLAPDNAEDAEAMRAGLQIYSIFNVLNSGGGITQNGNNNMGGVAQNGGGNFGVVHQEGNGHSGTVEQNGSNNAFGLFQFGEGTHAQAVQTGDYNTGAAFVFGWE